MTYRLPPKLAHVVLASGYVWCDEHGVLHERTRDPYGYGEPDCAVENWRRVYIESNNKRETF